MPLKIGTLFFKGNFHFCIIQLLSISFSRGYVSFFFFSFFFLILLRMKNLLVFFSFNPEKVGFVGALITDCTIGESFWNFFRGSYANPRKEGGFRGDSISSKSMTSRKNQKDKQRVNFSKQNMCQTSSFYLSKTNMTSWKIHHE